MERGLVNKEKSLPSHSELVINRIITVKPNISENKQNITNQTNKLCDQTFFVFSLFLIRVFNTSDKNTWEKTDKMIQMGFSVIYSIMYITTIIT